MNTSVGEVTIMYHDSNFLLIHTERESYSPTKHLFRMDGMYTIVSELEKNQLQWKYWILWDDKMYWSHEEITDIGDKPYRNQFGKEFFTVVSNWVAEVLILRGEANERF